MGLRILKEDAQSRTIGYPVKDAVKIYPGAVCVLEKISDVIRIRPWTTGDRAAALVPVGLGIDSNVPFPVAPTGIDPHTVGEGKDYTNYNRGGLIAAIRQATVVIYDDKRDATSNLIDPAATFPTISAPVYVNDSCLFTEDSTNAVAVGVLEDVVLDGSDIVSITVRITIV